MGEGAMGPMMGSAMRGGCPMGGPMQRSTLGVAEDGVYVLSGNALLKYDSNLRLVKQVIIPVRRLWSPGPAQSGPAPTK